MTKTIFLILYLSLVIISISGQTKLHSLFTDNMVLQANAVNKIWGWGDSGQEVEVLFLSKSHSAITDSTGSWEILIQCPGYGGPYNLTVISSDTLQIKNILLGDVWICSGQSNMGMPLAGWGRVSNFKEEIANANFPNIRLCTIPLTKSPVPQSNVEVDGWYECSPASVEEFSAAAYFFGREIYKKANIPIGLIHVSKGGTPIETWMSEQALSNYPEFAEDIEFVKNNTVDDYYRIEKKYKTDYLDWLESIYQNDPGYNETLKWFDENYDFSKWTKMNIPSVWENEGLDNYDGTVWFKKEFDLPESMNESDLQLSLGPVQDYDITYVNGIKIGEQLKRNDPSEYTIPKAVIKPGKNTITVRVLDNYGVGGLWAKEDELFITDGEEKIGLSGTWQYKPGLQIGTEDFAPPERPLTDRKPTILFNGMISPITNFETKGIIWYQGESNASRAYQYRNLFKDMINEWRGLWNDENLPFYFVQLANYKQKVDYPQESSWAELREAQTMALDLRNTGMAVTIDIGNADDVHPKNKQEVGKRLSLIVLNNLYGKDVEYSGPVFEKYEIVGDTVIISFNHVNSGLCTIGEDILNGFAIAGSDRVFYWADAEIKNNKVIVYSEKVEKPVSVRYNWGDNPDGNLYNNAKLPAVPFRIDNWDGLTVNAE